MNGMKVFFVLLFAVVAVHAETKSEGKAVQEAAELPANPWPVALADNSDDVHTPKPEAESLASFTPEPPACDCGCDDEMAELKKRVSALEKACAVKTPLAAAPIVEPVPIAEKMNVQTVHGFGSFDVPEGGTVTHINGQPVGSQPTVSKQATKQVWFPRLTGRCQVINGKKVCAQRTRTISY